MRSNRKAILALGALGVVFGDIGTSPLYAFQEIFDGVHDIPAVEHRVYGAASMVFWTLTLIVSVKYVLIVMRADNDGEGGIMALASLAVSKVKHRRKLIMSLGILGAALFYGDGMITPAVSVLSAVEGLEIVDSGLTQWVVPIAVVILIGLFMVQRHGTGKMGAAFGPVMLVWFIAIAVLGLTSLVQTPEIIAAVNPTYAVGFFAGEPVLAFLALGSVVLCVTGAEALYADMGQFGRGPIRFSWFVIAVPALYLNYFGQAALVVRQPTAATNPFYLMVPDAVQLPMVILATLATVIASQAVISGAFSMTRQAIQLDYLPRLLVRHTSSHERGQVYVPAVNWMLMIAVAILVISFQDSSKLASAYGIAVTGTFVITTCLITVVALNYWKVKPVYVWPVFAIFFIIDSAFFLANLTKFADGGWFPLAVAFIVFSVLMTWRRGRFLMQHKMSKLGPPLADFIPELEANKDIVRVSGSRVYLANNLDVTPFALVQQTRLLKTAADQIVLLQFVTATTPRVDPDKRLIVRRPYKDVTQVAVHLGFMERVKAVDVMDAIAAEGVPIVPSECVYVVHQVTIEPSKDAAMWMRRQLLYAFMQRVALNPSVYLRLPIDRVLGVWTVIKLGDGKDDEVLEPAGDN